MSATRRPSGMRTVRSCRLCSRAPTIVIAPSARRKGTIRERGCAPRRPAAPRRGWRRLGRRRSSSPVAESFASQGARRAREEHLAAAAARVGPEVDHVVGGRDRVRVVLDDDDRVAAVAPARGGWRAARRVSRGVEADRRLVEHVERPVSAAAERATRGRCAATRRPRACARRGRASGSRARRRSCSRTRAFSSATTDAEARLLRRGEHERRPEQAVSSRSGSSTSSAIVLPAKADRQRRRRRRAPPQARAERVGAVARQQDAHVDLVALASRASRRSPGRRRSRRAP